ncbi:MAG: penicillin-binding protein activator LpoB [Nitrospirota bacterium]
MKHAVMTLAALVLVVGVTAGGCGKKQVSRVDVTETIDLSGRWNDTDSRMVAETMVSEALSRPWVDKHVKEHRKDPTVIVGTVVNRSHEHISVATFTKDLERELTNSGRVQFVASKGEREELREERIEQQTHSSEETAKGLGKEIGADYMLKGEINSIEDEEGREKVVYYQVTLEMINLETNVKVWFGDKKIKKLVERKRFGF